MMRQFAALFLAIAMVGCGARVKTVTDLPTNVTQKQAQNWDSAVANLHKLADSVKTLRTAITIVHNQSDFVADEYYYKALTALGHVDQYELEAVRFLEGQPQTFGASTKQKLASEMKLISDELATLVMINATGIKAEGSKTTVGQLIAELTATVNIILAIQV